VPEISQEGGQGQVRAMAAENMIKVPENGQEGGQGQVRAKAVLFIFRSRFPKGRVRRVE